jgi:hypothetical protein
MRYWILLAALLTGCASSGVVPTGGDTYMLAKTGAGGMFSSGAAVAADLYAEANTFCGARGLAVETIDSEAENAIPFVRMNRASLKFRCATPPK